MKLHQLVLFSLMLGLPLALKLGTPALLAQGERSGVLKIFQPQADRSRVMVESVEGYTLITRTSDNATLKVKLAGLQNLDRHWQNQAASVIAMVLQSSGGTVSLSYMQPLKFGREIRAIATLPNGTSLQQILLTDGLAKFDLSQPLPIGLPQAFQAAEADARSQGKNVWGGKDKIVSESK